jgi:hypothetical protein
MLRHQIIFFPIVEEGAKFVGVFRVKNHDFTPKNHIPPGSAPAFGLWQRFVV